MVKKSENPKKSLKIIIIIFLPELSGLARFRFQGG